MKRYIRVYEVHRLSLIRESLHGFAVVSLDAINPLLLENRITNFLEKRKADATGVLELNFTSFLREINTWLERYYGYLEDEIENKSEGTAEEEHTFRHACDTLEGGTLSLENTHSI